jgi:predicted GNAT family acetyltransferase
VPALDVVAMGLFELRRVEAVPRPAGRRRRVEPGDAGRLQAWIAAFHDEAVPADPPVQPGAGERAAVRGMSHLWLSPDDTPVAWASFGRELEGFVSIGPVYTPPEHRGRGYATALVAEMSALALAEGRVGCTLFTDLANPTSNRIYERIGYRRIGKMKRCLVRG